MDIIKLNLRIKTGYHHSDPNANAITFVNVDKIDFYYDESHDGYKSVISINSKEFKCTASAAEITERIVLVEIAGNLA